MVRDYYCVRGYNVTGNGGYSPTANAQTLALGSFVFSAVPSSVLAAAPFSYTVTARDTGGNLATNYRGTVRFSSSDAAATLPGNYSFVAADNGVHTFTNQTLLRTPGSQTVAVADTVNSAARGQFTLTVNPITVTVNGSAAGDTILLRNQGGNPNLYELLVNGVAQSQGWWVSLSSITINGLGGPDTITLERVRSGLPVAVNGGLGDDIIHIGTAASSLTNIAGPVSVNGDDGNDSLTVNDQAGPGSQDIYLTATTVRRTGTATVTYGSLEGLTIRSSSAGFMGIWCSGTAPGTPVALVGTGENYLILEAGSGFFEIFGGDTGQVSGDALGSLVTFTGVGSLVGGPGDDWFYFYDGAGLTGFIDGLGGINTLDYSAYTTGVYVELHTGIAQGTLAIGHITNVFGGSGPDYLHGDSDGNWLAGNDGDDILVGDEGADYVQGGAGRDLVFGGGGADYLEAGLDDDLLIDGYTSYDNDPAALDQIWFEGVQSR